jgi:predicted transcriptional regulator
MQDGRDLVAQGEADAQRVYTGRTEAIMDGSASIKREAQRLVDQLPEQASWDDLMYEIYVRQAVDRGIADADAGRVVSHDEAMRRLGLKQ